MRICRTIFAVLIGLSVATLPAANGFSAGMASAAEVSVSAAVPDCDHHHGTPNGNPHKAADDSACMAGCALNCFNFISAGVSEVAFSSPVGVALKLVRMSSKVRSQIGNPPFRPPRS